MEGEAELLGQAHSFACLCRTTERDLGDGSPNVGNLVRAKVRLCTGVDSHAFADPFEEARAIELDERTRTQRRQVALDGETLLRIASTEGYAAIGADGADEDCVELDPNDLSTLGCDDPSDGLFFSATSRSVTRVVVAGRTIAENGHVPDEEAIRRDYLRALTTLE